MEQETPINKDAVADFVKNEIASVIKSAVSESKAIEKAEPKMSVDSLVKGIVDGSLKRTVLEKAPTTFNSNASVADGGALLVPELDRTITAASFSTALLAKVGMRDIAGETMYTTSKQYPAVTADAQAAQGDEKTQRKLQFSRGTLTLQSYYWLVNVSNQLLEDAPQLANEIVNESASQIQRDIEYGILVGHDSFTGIIGDAGTVTVARDTADDVKRVDLATMWSRLWTNGGLNEAALCWVISPSVWPKIDALRDTTVINVEGRPTMTIFGIPVVKSCFSPALGTTGDVVLGDFSKYALGRKARMISTEISTHLWFNYNETAFRTEARLAGIPVQRTKITENSVTYGFFVELGSAGGSDAD